MKEKNLINYLQPVNVKGYDSSLNFILNHIEKEKLEILNRESIISILSSSHQKYKNKNTEYWLKAGLYNIVKRNAIAKNQEKFFKSLKPAFDVFKIKRDRRAYFSHHYLDDEQFARLIRLSNKKERNVIETIALSGVRVSEFCNIKLSHISKNKKSYSIIIPINKNRKPRTFFLPINIVESIKKNFDSKIYLFENYKKEKFSINQIEKMFSKFSKRIGKRVTPHLLRHWFINKRSKESSIFELDALASYVGNTFNVLVKHYLQGEMKQENSYHPVLKSINLQIKKHKKRASKK